jgi:hypothetical protein
MLNPRDLHTQSKASNQRIIDYVGNNEERMAELMGHFFGADTRICQVTSWAVGHIGELHPNLVQPYHQKLITTLK